MARRPRRSRFDCWFSWLNRKIRGRQIMPRVTSQLVDHFCRAHAAVETFEARARMGLCFPTLSILHLIDLLRDAEVNAKTLAEKNQVGDGEYGFRLLASNGVCTKEAYDAAPPIPGQFTRNVEGLQHYRIKGHTVCHVQDGPFLHMCKEPKGWNYPIEEIASNGPIYAWFQPYKTFLQSDYRMYRTPKKTDPGHVLMRPHALCLFGMGSRGRKTFAFAHQNNWGIGHHHRGRGILHFEVLIDVIVPQVEKTWTDSLLFVLQPRKLTKQSPSHLFLTMNDRNLFSTYCIVAKTS